MYPGFPQTPDGRAGVSQPSGSSSRDWAWDRGRECCGQSGFFGGAIGPCCLLDVQLAGCVSVRGMALQHSDAAHGISDGITRQGYFGAKDHHPEHLTGEVLSHLLPPRRRRNRRGSEEGVRSPSTVMGHPGPRSVARLQPVFWPAISSAVRCPGKADAHPGVPISHSPPSTPSHTLREEALPLRVCTSAWRGDAGNASTGSGAAPAAHPTLSRGDDSRVGTMFVPPPLRG